MSRPACATDCHPFVSRSAWVPTPFPPLRTSEVQLAAEFPWWGGQWRTRTSPPLPQVFYPNIIWPRGVCEADWPDPGPQSSSLTPNWALDNLPLTRP